MRTALITIVAGRLPHLRRQLEGLGSSSRPPDVHVVVAMDVGELPRLRALCGPSSQIVTVAPPSPHELPLARARNVGARAALTSAAELLVFLDVDCIPSDGLLERYHSAATRAGDALLCGPVAYLPPRPPGGYPPNGLAALASPHPDRPVPADDDLVAPGDHRLFWSISFAVRASTWRAIGGFCERYTGYGAEDTDFGQIARRAGIELCWVGGASAYHQHHDSPMPPVQHLDDILRNASTFEQRWGWWPMQGWLDQFAEMGLVRFAPDERRWLRTSAERA